jgi:hypothetical protein
MLFEADSEPDLIVMAHTRDFSDTFNRQQPFFKNGPAMGLDPFEAEFCAI